MKKIFCVVITFTLLSSLFALHCNAQLFGMTNAGGTYNQGIIYKINLDGSNFQVVHNFDSVTGSQPYGGLLHYTNGMLYGVTAYGGDSNRGVIFKFDTAGNHYQKTFDFLDDATGYNCFGNMILADTAYFFGMTTFGGSTQWDAYGEGVIFVYDPATDSCFNIFNFDGGYFATPYGSFTKASDGILYGMTSYGGGIGYPSGMVFSLNLVTSTIDVYYSLNNNIYNLEHPKGTPMMANNNKLYCMSPSTFYVDTAKMFHGGFSCGGNYFGGFMQANDNLVYAFDSYSYGILGVNPITDVCITYNQTYPAIPIGTPLQASNNKIYGVTVNGGAYGYGRLFYYDNISNNITYIHDFDSVNGAFKYDNYNDIYPKGDLIELINTTGIHELNNPNQPIITISPNPFSYSTAITIKCEYNIRSGSLLIYDITGREVARHEGINGNNSQFTLNRNQLESGMYFYKLFQNNSDLIANGKLIIQ